MKDKTTPDLIPAVGHLCEHVGSGTGRSNVRERPRAVSAGRARQAARSRAPLQVQEGRGSAHGCLREVDRKVTDDLEAKVATLERKCEDLSDLIDKFVTDYETTSEMISDLLYHVSYAAHTRMPMGWCRRENCLISAAAIECAPGVVRSDSERTLN